MTGARRAGPEAQRQRWAIGLIVLVLAVGTLGYMVLGLPFADAIYQTGITVTTVGFGEVTDGGEPSAAYRWFTLSLVLGGATSAVFAAGVVLELMADRRAGVFRERRMHRQISALRGHVVICGYGRVGRAVARRADGLGADIVVVEQAEERLADCPYPSVVGDATTDDVLHRAGVGHAASLVAGLSTDAANLFLAVSARQLHPGLRIASRANDADNARKLRAMDIDTVVDPYEMAGARLATAALRPNTSAYLDQVFSNESDAVELTELELDEHSAIVDLTIADTEERHQVVVVAHRAAGATSFTSPRGFAGRLARGDVVIVLGDRASVAAVQGRS